MSKSVAVLGASGYGGAELVRLLAAHPDFDVVVATAQSQAGQRLSEVYPHLRSDDLFLRELGQVEDEVAACDVVFSALPHGESMRVLPALTNELVVDLSGDFRLDDVNVYEDWYGLNHVAHEELHRWTYGLPELFRDEIVGSRRIASPGCYATAAILGLAPLISESMIEGSIVVDAMSGTSGAGRAPKPGLHYAHVAEDVRAYKIGEHQHTPEIERTLEFVSDRPVTVSFTAHLVPMARGIHATCSAEVVDDVDIDEIRSSFDDLYRSEPFVDVVASPPGTKQVRGSNMALVHPSFDPHSGRVIVTSVIDNLVKGAAGQAIQNANLALGFDETTGLSFEAIYP